MTADFIARLRPFSSRASSASRSRRLARGGLCLVLGLCAAPPAVAQGMGISAGANFDARILERAAEMPLGEVFARGLVLTYESGSRSVEVPIDARFVGVLLEDGRVTRTFASEPFRLEPGRTAAGSNRTLMSSLSQMLGDRTVPADEAFPADRYVVADRAIGAGQLIPALDGSSKDAGDLLAGAFPRIDPSTQVLIVAIVPADRRALERSETRPVMAVIRKMGG